MLILSTYQLTPHLPVNSKTDQLNTLMFREMVNKLVRDKWDKFVAKGADPSLFFNHDPETGKTRVGYPLVIYHFINDNFYITGINKGSEAVELLAKLYKIPFGSEGLLFPGFRKLKKAGTEIKCLPGAEYSYRLVKWVPFHYKDYRQFDILPFAEKVSELNQRLKKHIEADLAKYLELNTEHLHVVINNLEYNYTEPVLYEKHKYHACDIEFTTSMDLPGFLTLGNIKSLGFGRVERM